MARCCETYTIDASRPEYRRGLAMRRRSALAPSITQCVQTVQSVQMVKMVQMVQMVQMPE